MKEFLKDFKGNMVLDAGCGYNPLSKEVAEGCIIGLDIKLECLKEAKKLGLEVVSADLNRGIPFKDESFDLIIATGNIPSIIYDTDYLLEEMRRVLKMLGVLIIDVYNTCSLRNRLRVGVGLTPLGLMPLGIGIKAFNKSIFVALLEKHHFRIEDVRATEIRIPKIAGIPWRYKFLVSLGEFIIVKCRKVRK